MGKIERKLSNNYKEVDLAYTCIAIELDEPVFGNTISIVFVLKLGILLVKCVMRSCVKGGSLQF